ncbi:MAG: FAD-dependent monooxygenase, partial [Candidatus Micrarchaeota archaeon]|nr:FAD-dependent monooxygenase [Candidatus Micrarchaeota archaeon]
MDSTSSAVAATMARPEPGPSSAGSAALGGPAAAPAAARAMAEGMPAAGAPLAGEYDVIVCGSGPGGSSAAAYCGRAGLKVLVLDKASFPRDKTCGDALSGKSMTVIRELGLVGEIEKLPHGSISGVTFSAPSGKLVSIPFAKTDPNRPGGAGYCMRRLHTDFMLYNAARKTAGVKIVEKFQVSEVLLENGRAVGVKGIDLADPSRAQKVVRAKVVVGADGVNSAVARAVLGEKAALDPKHSCDALRVYYDGITGMSNDIEIHFFKSCMPGYFWIFPLDNGTANVGIGLISKDLSERMVKENTNLIKMLNDAIANEPLVKERFAHAKALGPITGWRLPFGSYRRQLAGDGWVLVGD